MKTGHMYVCSTNPRSKGRTVTKQEQGIACFFSPSSIADIAPFCEGLLTASIMCAGSTGSFDRSIVLSVFLCLCLQPLVVFDVDAAPLSLSFSSKLLRLVVVVVVVAVVLMVEVFCCCCRRRRVVSGPLHAVRGVVRGGQDRPRQRTRGNVPVHSGPHRPPQCSLRHASGDLTDMRHSQLDTLLGTVWAAGEGGLTPRQRAPAITLSKTQESS